MEGRWTEKMGLKEKDKNTHTSIMLHDTLEIKAVID